MKIAYLAQLSPEVRHPPFDGPANHIRHLSAALRRTGHSVRFLGGIEGQLWQSDDLLAFEPVVPGPRAGWVERGVRRVQSGLRLPYFNYFDSRRFADACVHALSGSDLICERASWMSYGGALSSRAMKIPLVLEYNGDPLHDLEAKGIDPRGLQRGVSTWLFKRSLASAAHIIASGKGWQENLIHRWQIHPKKITVIENGTPLLDLLTREQLRTFQPPQPGQPVQIVYLGGFYAWHGTRLAVEAFSALNTRGVDARLVMIGAGVEWQETRDLAASLGLSDKISFPGALSPEDYAPLLASAEIGLSPYCGWKEYSGLKLFDYKAAGLATIASGENGQPVTLAHEHTGWIIPPCDQQALTDSLYLLATQSEIRRRIGQAARIEAEALHSWQRTAAETERVFTRVIQESPTFTQLKKPYVPSK